MEVVLVKVALGGVFLLVLRVGPVVIIPPMIRIDILTDLPIHLSLCVSV
jgi:hypothetical protein